MPKTTTATHESLARDGELAVGSDRSFGFVFAVFFALVGLYPLFFGGAVRAWSLGAAGAFLLVAVTIPRMLHPLNVLWMKFGSVLHRIVSPIVLGLLFFVTITPMAVLMRWMGKDPLRLRFDRGAESYWIPRDPPGPPPETMKNQF